MINLHKRMLLTSAGVEPVTSWSPVRQRIQLSHRGRRVCVVIRSNTVSVPSTLTFTTLWANFADEKLMTFFLFFSENIITFHAKCPLETICMKCHLFSGKNKKKYLRVCVVIRSNTVSVPSTLTFTTLWANFADEKLMTFFLFFSENII